MKKPNLSLVDVESAPDPRITGQYWETIEVLERHAKYVQFLAATMREGYSDDILRRLVVATVDMYRYLGYEPQDYADLYDELQEQGEDG